MHPLNALSLGPFPTATPCGARASIGRGWGATWDAPPGAGNGHRCGHQVMRGGYMAGTFRRSDGGSPECRHNVDVSEAC